MPGPLTWFEETKEQIDHQVTGVVSLDFLTFYNNLAAQEGVLYQKVSTIDYCLTEKVLAAEKKESVEIAEEKNSVAEGMEERQVGQGTEGVVVLVVQECIAAAVVVAVEIFVAVVEDGYKEI